jgi:hypothetical protein
MGIPRQHDLGELLTELGGGHRGVGWLVGVDADRDQWRFLGSGLRSRIDGGQNWVGLSHAPIRSRHRSSNATSDRTRRSAWWATSNVESARRAEDAKPVIGRCSRRGTGTQSVVCRAVEVGVAGKALGGSPSLVLSPLPSNSLESPRRALGLPWMACGWIFGLASLALASAPSSCRRP